MNFISNEDLIYSRFPEELKFELNEFQHKLLSSDSTIYRLDLSEYSNYIKLVNAFFLLKGYYTEIDDNSIYVMLHD